MWRSNLVRLERVSRHRMDELHMSTRMRENPQWGHYYNRAMDQSGGLCFAAKHLRRVACRATVSTEYMLSSGSMMYTRASRVNRVTLTRRTTITISVCT
jgi:hypothetical protein